MKLINTYITFLVSIFVTGKLNAGINSNQPLDSIVSKPLNSIPLNSIPLNSKPLNKPPVTMQRQDKGNYIKPWHDYLKGYAGQTGSPVNPDNYTVIIQEGGFQHHGRQDVGQTANWHHYSVYVPTDISTIHIQNAGGIGDGDLHTNGNGIPSASDYDCRPYRVGNDEACIATNLSAGSEYYYSINLYDPTYYGSDLTVNYNLPNSNNTDRTEGFGWPANSFSSGTMQLFNIYVPDGLQNLKITTSGGSGNADIYMEEGHNTPISPGNAQWDSTGSDNSELISMSSPSSGTYTIGLYAETTINDVHLRVRYDAYDPGAASSSDAVPPPPSHPDTTALYHNQWSQRYYDGAIRYFHVDVPSGNSWLTIFGNNWEGDMDVYVSKERIPSTSDYDCRSINSGFMVDGYNDGFGYKNNNAEECRLPVNGSATYYVMVTTYKQRYYSQAEVLAYYYSTPSKSSGDSSGNSWSIADLCNSQGPSTHVYELLYDYASEETICIPNSSNITDGQGYWIRVPSTFNITLKTDHGTGGGDLYITKSSNGWPTAYESSGNVIVTNHTKSSSNSNNRECIEISDTNFTDPYIHIVFIGEQSGVTLQATMDDPDGCAGT